MVNQNILNYNIYDFSKPWIKGKTPLLLIHGLGANLKMWFPQVPDFSKHFPVITIDLPGCGNSTDTEKELTIEYMAEAINETLEIINIKKVNILGISLGGFVAIEYAVKYGDKINKLILSSTPYGFDESIIPYLKNMLKTYENMTTREIAEARIKKAFSESADIKLVEYLTNQIAETKHSVYVRMAGAPLKFNAKEKISQINIPTLILVGEFDYLATIQDGEKIQSKIKNSILKILSKTGHASSLENPDDYNNAVLSFLINEE